MAAVLPCSPVPSDCCPAKGGNRDSKLLLSFGGAFRPFTITPAAELQHSLIKGALRESFIECRVAASTLMLFAAFGQCPQEQLVTLVEDDPKSSVATHCGSSLLSSSSHGAVVV